MTISTQTLPTRYSWAWVEEQKDQGLRRKIRATPDIILSQLTKELQSRPVPPNSGILASRILRNLQDSTLNTPTGKAFFRSIQKTQLFAPHNNVANLELYDLTVHAIAEKKTYLSQKIISFSHCCDNEMVFLACMHGNLTALKELIKQGADVDALGDEGNTPLHIIAMTGRDDLFNLLLEEGANINAKNALGKTPLHLAVENHHISIIQSCISNGANLNPQDENGNTPLLEANFSGNGDAEVLLLRAGADPLVENTCGHHYNPDFINRMISAEIFKDLPLFSKLIREHEGIEKISALFADNIEEIIVNDIEANLLEVPFICNNPEVLKNLCDRLPRKYLYKNVKHLYEKYPLYRNRLLCLFSEAGFKLGVEILIKLGAEVNTPRKYGMFPIHYACISKSLETVCLLKKHGANLDAQEEKQGNSPLHLALEYRNSKLFLFLLESGCNANLLNTDGQAVLHLAVIDEAYHLITMLVPYTSLDIQNSNGKTALHLACALDKREAIDKLLGLVAATNIVDYKGNSPLHTACLKGDNSTAIKLYKQGSVFWTLNQNNESAISIAIENQMNSFVDEVFKNYDHIHYMMDQEVGCVNFIDNLCQNPKALLDPHLLGAGAIPLEVPMLLKSEKLAKSMMLLMTAEQFSKQVELLTHKYPKDCIHFLHDCIYQQVPSHLTNGAAHLIDIPEPPNIKIEVLNTLFSKINFSDPTKPGYQNPKKLTDDGVSTIRPVVASGLRNLIKRINKRIPFTGTPPKGTPQLQVFYNNLETLMKHVTKLLVDCNDPFTKSNNLIDIGVGGLHCGIRWITQAHQSYQMLNNGNIPLTFEERILELLRSYRTNVLLNVIARADVHVYNQLITLAGKELGIAGASSLTGYEDYHADKSITREEILEDFNNLYTSHTIIEFVKGEIQRLYKKLDTQDLIVDWFKDHIPEDWERDKFSILYQGVQNLIYRKKEKNAIRQYLLKQQVYCSEEGDPIKAIDDQRKSSYLEDEVFEKNAEGELTASFRREAIVHMLVTLGIFQKTELRKESSHRKRRKITAEIGIGVNL